MKTAFWAIIITALIVLGAYFIFGGLARDYASNDNGTEVVPSSVVYKDLIQIDSPHANEEIGSPVSFQGKARGTWYFEASFPVRVVDNEGNVLGTGIATAQGDWMTEDYVPFSGQISFSLPDTSSGEIIFIKDNPSDLRELDDQVSVPVRF